MKTRNSIPSHSKSTQEPKEFEDIKDYKDQEKTNTQITQISHTQPLLYTQNDRNRTDQFDNCEELATKPIKKKKRRLDCI